MLSKLFISKKTQPSLAVSDTKIFLNKELFSAGKQTKAVTRAARESALEQQQLLKRYQKSIKPS
jgi:hypothetical protein